jgi:hypothetical protein
MTDPDFVDSGSDERTVNNPATGEARAAMRHQYRVLSEAEKADMLAIKDLGIAAFQAVTELEERYGRKREYALAKTKIEEAVMWAVKGITQ